MVDDPSKTQTIQPSLGEFLVNPTGVSLGQAKPGDPNETGLSTSETLALIKERERQDEQNKRVDATESTEADLLGLTEDRLSALKSGTTEGKASKKALDYVEGIASALTADGSSIDLASLKLCYIRDNLAEFTKFSTRNRNAGGWANFICLEDDDVASFFSKVNGYYSRQSPMKRFLNMPSHEKAKLYPKIRLYKVLGGNQTEIHFPTSARNSMQSILNGGSADDFGLKSVEFDFKNQNAFGAGRIVDVRIQIYLLTGDSLTKDRGGYSLSDLILRKGQRDPKVYDSKSYELRMDVGYMEAGSQFLDQALRDNTVSMILNLVEYDLDVEQNGVISLSMSYKARIESDLEDKFDYDIFFNEGSAYRERVKELDELLSKRREARADLISKRNSAQQQIANIDEDIKTQDPNRKSTAVTTLAIARIDGGVPLGEPEVTSSGINKLQADRLEQQSRILDLDKRISSATDLVSAAGQSLAEAKIQNKVGKYGRLLEVLVAEKKINSIIIPKSSLAIYGAEFEKVLQEKIDQSLADVGITEAEDISRAANEIRNRVREQAKKNGVDLGELESLDFAQLVNQKVKADGISAKQAIMELDYSKHLTNIGEAAPSPPDTRSIAEEFYGVPEGFGWSLDFFGNKSDSKPEYSEYEKIYWFYLGDLINLLMRNNEISSKLERDKLGFIFGPVNIEVSQGRFVELANIADIPITMEMYQTFFFKNIVEKDLDQYFLHDFIKQAMSQLLVPSLNQKCFGVSTSNPISIDSVIIEVNKSMPSIYQSSENSTGPLSRRYYMDGSLKRELSNARIGVKNTKPDQRWNYVVFYSNDGRISNGWNGKEDQDMEKGIFHFRPGIDRGLVKKVSFRKNKKPGFTTMMVERAFSENKESLQLWAIFDIELTLIGNTLLKPGMHIYLDPSTVGMGSPQTLRSFSRSIGLGGYYLVTSVSNSISDGEWETNIIAKWVSSGSSAGSVKTASRKASVSQAKAAVGKDKKPVSKKKKKDVYDPEQTRRQMDKAMDEWEAQFYAKKRAKAAAATASQDNLDGILNP
jgi:hypothetical protein